MMVSHRAGWALYWAQEVGATLISTSQMGSLRTRLKSGDRVLVYHGMEYRDGVLNVYSSGEDKVVENYELLAHLAKRLGPNLVSLDIPMPDYGALIASRAAKRRVPGWERVDLAALSRSLRKSGMQQFPTGNPTELIIGDSHALSMYRPGARVVRLDGQTLHGALNGGTDAVVGGPIPRSVKRITVYLGNIDIRHHLCRMSDPKEAMLNLVKHYVEWLYKNVAGRVDHVEVVAPLFIESPTRRIPTPGQYKGKPFSGTWLERDLLRQQMTIELAKLCRAAGWHLHQHPSEFLNVSGELSEEVMEKPQSVHLRPAFYRITQETRGWTVISSGLTEKLSTAA